MTVLRPISGWLWKIPAAGTAHALGMMLGVAVVSALGLTMPRPIEGTDPTVQSLLLFPAGMAIALGMAAAAVGLPGNLWQRSAVLAFFMFVVHGIGNGLESSIFTTLGGAPAATLMLLPASVLAAVTVSWLVPGPGTARPAEAARAYFSSWSAVALGGRLLAALVAFPFIYFLFGMLIAPIVVPYYERIDFLTIPPIPVLLGVLFTRSALLLVASLPIVVFWRASRARLVVALGLAHFVAVGLAGLIQASFFPAIMRWTHGVEVFADSMCYALVLTWLLARPATDTTANRRDARDAVDPAPRRT